MSEYAFKNLSDVDRLEAATDNTTVMGFENSTPVQMPVSAVKGGGVFVIDTTAEDYAELRITAEYGNKIKDALLRGDTVLVHTLVANGDSSGYTGTNTDIYIPVQAFKITAGEYLIVYTAMEWVVDSGNKNNINITAGADSNGLYAGVTYALVDDVPL